MKPVLSVTSPQANNIGDFDWSTLLGSAAVGRASNEGQAKGVSNSENTDSSGIESEASVGSDVLVGFSPMHFHGLASDPDLWRITRYLVALIVEPHMKFDRS